MKKKVFIVDDDIEIHDLIAANLSSDEFEILKAFDGQDVVERIRNEQPDLIVLDIMLPVGDGRDICSEIRQNPDTKEMKILMLSAKSEHHERIQGLELGANEYITKPFNPMILANKIKGMCEII